MVISSFVSVLSKDLKLILYALLVLFFFVSTNSSICSTVSIKSPPIYRMISYKSFGLYSGDVHIEKSFVHTGYLLNSLNYEIYPCLNWLRNLGSYDQNSRTSGILNSFIANLYSPSPAAQPLSALLPPFSKTKLCTTPQPSISTHLFS